MERSQSSQVNAAASAPAGSGTVAYRFDSWTIVLGLFALGNLINGAWMLADPVHWYQNLPAAVPDFGPLNEHFVRDIGCIYFLSGVALAWAAVAAPWRLAACALVTGFYVLHAIVHVVDTLRGLVGPEHWTIDLSGIYVPAALMVVLTWRMTRSRS